MFGNQPPHPPTFGKTFPQKNFFFWGGGLPLFIDCEFKTKVGNVSPSILVPFYDEDSSTLFLAGKGENVINAYEVEMKRLMVLMFTGLLDCFL